MRKILFLLGLFALSLSPLKGEVAEIQSIEEVLPYLEPKAFVIFGIDNTLLQPAQMLGSDAWFRWRIGKQLLAIESYEEAYRAVLPELYAIYVRTAVRPIESVTHQIVAAVQQRGYPVIGMTRRGFLTAHITQEHLRQIQVDLKVTAPCLKSPSFDSKKDVGYLDGVLFCEREKSGKMLKVFLEKCGLQPEKIVFINDKVAHLEDVDKEFKNSGIMFVGLRYGGADESDLRFNSDIAEIQEQYAKAILPDQVAKVIVDHAAKK